MKISIWAILSLLCTFLAASPCSAAAPSVISYSPSSGATGVGTNANVHATFDEAVTGVSTTTFKVYAYTSSSSTNLGDANSEITGTVSYSGTKATFAPTSGLTASKVHRPILTTGIKNAGGTPLAADATWKFTTGSTSDTTAPTISSLSPSEGAYGVAENAALVVVFSESMDPETITSSTVYIEGVTGTVAYSGGNNQATFTPSSDLNIGTTYTAKITTGVKDTAGNALASSKEYIFTVGNTGGALKKSSISGGIVTLQVVGGGGTIQLFEPLSDTSSDIVQKNKPADGTFPEGLISLRVGGLAAGGTAVLKLTFETDLPEGTQIWKSGPDGFYDFTANAERVNANTYNITLVDGGAGDSDKTANGVIVDPVGPVTGLASETTNSSGSTGCVMNPQADLNFELILLLLGAVIWMFRGRAYRRR